MASNNWHKLNNFVCEIERTTNKIFEVKNHCQTHKHSILKNKIPELISKQETLHRQMESHIEQWQEKVCC